jgi:hypothetical protein
MPDEFVAAVTPLSHTVTCAKIRVTTAMEQEQTISLFAISYKIPKLARQVQTKVTVLTKV